MEMLEQDVKTLYWFDLTIEEVALVTNSLYHQLETKYNTVQVIVQERDGHYHRYMVIAICCPRQMGKKEIMKYIERIPDFNGAKT